MILDSPDVLTSGVITLLTDFGTDDPFVGVMKGVILGHFPEARIVDLTHGIGAQDVAHGAFWLERSFRWFPAGTVHVAVVDPGVGTARAPLCVRAAQHVFVGPDNGLLAGIIARERGAEVRAIDLGAAGLPAPSATFHGRDVFAPVAAQLSARRRAFDEIGPLVSAPASPVLPQPERVGDEARGTVVCSDRFGNLISNLDASLLGDFARPEVEIGGIVRPLVRTYADGEVSDYVAVINAFGTVELALRDGSAARALGIGRGAAVIARPGGRSSQG
jgi:S-adenosyl-L-methionine hydrolase (adenosine-forming)